MEERSLSRIECHRLTQNETSLEDYFLALWNSLWREGRLKYRWKSPLRHFDTHLIEGNTKMGERCLVIDHQEGWAI